MIRRMGWGGSGKNETETTLVGAQYHVMATLTSEHDGASLTSRAVDNQLTIYHVYTVMG